MTDAIADIETHRSYLYRYALLHVRDADRARRDHWHTFPPTWQDPERSFEQARFWEVFERCNVQLPAQTARVFAMREFMGMETGDICKELGITSTNCWVMLFRARMSLRECLETNWFVRSPEGLRRLPKLLQPDGLPAHGIAQSSGRQGGPRGQ